MERYQISKPVPLEGTHNFRSLGGYPAGEGMIREGLLYRSDGLSALTEKDRSWMKEHDITCVLDLRSRREAGYAPDALDDAFAYYAIPMSDRMGEAEDEDAVMKVPDRLSDLYIRILETHQNKFLKIMRVIIERAGKPVVFHCTAGKDRTGVTAMLLLLLAGTPEEIIVADYAVSAENMHDYFEEKRIVLRQMGVEIPDVMFASPAGEMERTIAYMKKQWGTAQEYLHSCGVTEQELECLKGILADRNK